MYKEDKEMQCLICNKVIQDSFYSLTTNNKVCFDCLRSFKRREDICFIEKVECLILYYYDDFFRDVLYRYKGCYDYVLKDVFLNYKINYLKRKYRGYTIVLAPSSDVSEMRRGFNHLECIFKCLDLPIVKCFKKSEDWKQSDKKMCERQNIQKVIKLDKRLLEGVKKVLIVDDVLTSGSTIKTMLKQIPANIDKKVLVLSSNCRILMNEIV